MAKINRTIQDQNIGMARALATAKQYGIDALERDVKMRNILGIDARIPTAQVNEVCTNISINCYTSIMVTMLYTLHKNFGFGKDRLHKLKKQFDENANDLLDVDRWGEHYATFKEYEALLHTKYGFDFSEKTIAHLDLNNNGLNPEYKRCELSTICDLLDASGYKDAAAFLREKELIDATDKHYAKKVLTLPKYQEYRKRYEKESTLDAFYAFCFTGSDFLESKCQCTQGALVKEFLNHSKGMLYKMDEQYFIDRVAYYKRRGIDVLEILECEFEEEILNESTEMELV
jgi:hypothetical protein